MLPSIDTTPEPMVRETGGRQAEPAAGHICPWCPNCAAKLQSSRCKLVCRQCGYYMSCADYY